MAIQPVLIQAAPDSLTTLKSAAVAYWTPDSLGTNARVMAAGTLYNTPALFGAGLNAFMIWLHMAPAVTVSMSVNIHRPTDEVMIFPAAKNINPAVVADQMLTFGAFSTDAPLPTTRGFVWWLLGFEIAVGGVGTTVTIGLFGGRR